jgi:CDGSH-type Zn-finger protein
MAVSPGRADAVEVVLCPGGPKLVRGATDIVDEQGQRFAVHRPVVAVCRCRKSTRLPWCDGTHKLLPPERRP